MIHIPDGSIKGKCLMQPLPFHKRLAVAETLLRKEIDAKFNLSEEDRKYYVEFELEVETPSYSRFMLTTSRPEDAGKHYTLKITSKLLMEEENGNEEAEA